MWKYGIWKNYLLPLAINIVQVHDSVDLKNKHLPRWVLWFIFNLRLKNRLVIRIILRHYDRCTQWSFSYLQYKQFMHTCIHTWETRRCQHCSEWVHPCSSLKAGWFFLFTTRLWGCWTASHASDSAWLFSAWIALVLLMIKVSDFKHNKSYIYTSQLKQYKAQHSNYTYTHSWFFSPFHTDELKRPAGPETFFQSQYSSILFC
jgi:hypothetical protein